MRRSPPNLRLSPLLAALVLALPACSCDGGGETPPPTADAGAELLSVVTGAVLDPDEKPVADAEVSAGKRSTRTGSDGRFALAVVADGAPSLAVRAEGFAKAERRFELKGGRASVGAVVLSRLTASASVDGAGGTVAGDGLSVVVPAGAFSRAVVVEAALVPLGDPLLDDLRLPLPIPAPAGGAVAPIFGLVLEAEGEQPAVPLEVSLASSARLPEGTQVPIGRYDLATARWVDAGLALAGADGTLGFAIDHLSTFAAALPAIPSASATPPEIDGLSRARTPFLRGEPRVDPRSGALQVGVELPGLVRRGEKISLTLFHDSRTTEPTLSAPIALPDARPGQGLIVEARSAFDEQRAEVVAADELSDPPVVVSELEPRSRELASSLRAQAQAPGEAAQIERLSSLETGAHEITAKVLKPVDATLAASANGSFASPKAGEALRSGGSAVPAPGRVALSSVESRLAAVDNRSRSPFGRGWHLRGLTRLVQPWCSDALATLAGGYETPAIAFAPDTALFLSQLAPRGLPLAEHASPPRIAWSGGRLFVGFENESDLGDAGGEIWLLDAAGTNPVKLAGKARSEGGQTTCTTADGAEMHLDTLAGLFADPEGGGGVIFGTRDCLMRLSADGQLQRIAGDIDTYEPEAAPGVRLDEVRFAGELQVVAAGRAPGRYYLYSYTRGAFLVRDGVLERLRTRVTHPHGLYATFDADGRLYYSAPGSPCLFAHEDGLNDPPVFPACRGGYPSAPLDGPAEAARVGQVEALAFDERGDLWLIDQTFQALRRLGADGTLTTVAGNKPRASLSGVGGPAAQASLGAVSSLAVATPQEIALGGVGLLLQLDPPQGAAMQGLAASDYSTLKRLPDGTWVRTLADATEERYDANGLLQSRGRPGEPPLELVYWDWKVAPAAQRCGQPEPPPLLKSILYAGEELFRFEYDGADGLMAIIDAAGRRTQLSWQGDRVSGIAPPGGGVAFGYDDSGRIVERSSANGSGSGSRLTWRYTYENGRIAGVDVPGRGHRTFESAEGVAAIPREKLSAAGIARGVTARPAISTITTGRGATAHIALGAGALRVESPSGESSELQMDAQGRLLRERRPDGSELVFTRDRAGRIVSLENAVTGDRWSYHYDVRGLLEYRNDPAGEQTHYSYDSEGRLAARFEPGGATTSFSYVDTGLARGLVASMRDGLGRETRFTYDEKGNLIGSTGPDGEQTSVERDALGRAIKVVEPSGLVQLTRYDDRDGVVEQQQRGEGPEATKVVYRRVIADGWESEGSHVPASAMLGATDEAGRDWSFARDDAFQLERLETPGEGRVDQRFDELGRRVRRATEDGSAEITEWDEQGRVSRRFFEGPAAGAELRLGYDPLGRVASLLDPLLSEERTFEAGVGWTRMSVVPRDDAVGEAAAFTLHRSRVSSRLETQALGATRFLIHREHDGQVASVELEPAQVSGPRREVLRFAYDAARKPTGLARGNGTTTVRVYDEAGRVVEQREQTPAGTTVLSWTWDEAGRPASRTVDGVTRVYGYDAQGRLASCSDTAESFTYEATGARASEGAHPYDRDARGRLSSDGLNDYAWDALGRRTARVSKADPANRLDLVYGPGGLLAETRRGATAIASYLYDGSGRRVRKTTAAGSWHYGYLPDSDRLVRLVEPDGTEWHLVHAWPSAPFTLAVSASGAERYVHLDPFERVVGISDESGALTLLDEDCWGNPRSTPALSGPRIGFHGMTFDEESGLYLAGARHYDPATGEWLAPDPAGIEAGTAPWGYGDGNPVLKADPSGRLFFLVFGAVLAGAAIANEIRQLSQSAEARRARSSYEAMTDDRVLDDDKLASAEEAHENLYEAADKGGDTAVECVKKGVEAVTNPAKNLDDLKDQLQDELTDAVMEAAEDPS